MWGEASRKAESLSSHNPSRINELQHILSPNDTGLGVESEFNRSFQDSEIVC